MAKILLAEDDPLIARMLTMRLKLRGHQVDIVENGTQAVDQALAGQYDAILMDMHMPVLDGHQATEKLRSCGYPGKIIAVTASATSKDSCRAIQSGCDAHIAKPVGDDFEDQIEAVIRD